MKIKNIFKNKKIKYISIAIILLLIFTPIISVSTINIINYISYMEAKEKPLIEYKVTHLIDGSTGKAMFTFNSANGLETIRYNDWNSGKEHIIQCMGKFSISIDYQIEDRTTYKFNIKEIGKDEETHSIYVEVPRIIGEYVKKNGVYANVPDLNSYEPEFTRYMYENSAGNLVPGNWLNGSEPDNWYNYTSLDTEGNQNPKWANVCVEIKGIENYYVWIPRYMYKVDTVNSVSGNERVDIKFVNTYNEYIDGQTEEKLTYDELVALGYSLPEAFMWKNSDDLDLIIPGFWMSKYQLSSSGAYKLYFDLLTDEDKFVANNLSTTLAEQASSYTYAINGKIVETKTSLQDYTFATNIINGTNSINITALDANGSIIGSMTKTIEASRPNPPDLSQFDPDTTFYVYYDSSGNEHNEIPISKSAPANWYNYSQSQWANIVVRTEGYDNYFVWIPRYQYKADSTQEKADVIFIEGNSIDTKTGYAIPEAFSWGDELDEQLTGYWMSKYQLSYTTKEATSAKLNADLTPSQTSISVGTITGTLLSKTETITNGEGIDEEVITPRNINYEYYLNGNKVHDGTNANENYTYSGLNSNTEYTINIILREQGTNTYIGAITRKINTL